MNFALEGAILGLTLSFLIGPVFFVLIQTGIERGFRGGISYCAGVWLSDTIIIYILYKGISTLTELIKEPSFKTKIGWIGGFLLIGFGLFSLLTKLTQNAYKAKAEKAPVGKLILKGFLINVFNPFTALYWLGVNTMLLAKYQLTITDAVLFFGSLMASLIVTDILKVLLAKKIRNWLKPEYIQRARQIAGVLLIISGIVLWYRISI